MRVHIDHLAGEIQIRVFSAPHRPRLNFPHADPAAGHHGLRQRPRRPHGQREPLQRAQQRLPLRRGHLVARQVFRQPAQPRKQLRQPRRQQSRQHVRQLLFAIGEEVPPQPGVQLLPAQPRLQVQPQLRAAGWLRQVAAGLEHQRPADPKMGEQHLSQLAVQVLLPARQRQCYVLQAQPLQGAGPVFLRFQPDQHRPRRCHRVPQRFRHPESVARGARGRVAHPAAGQDHPLRGQKRPVLQLRAGHGLPLRPQVPHSGVQPHPYAQRPHQARQRSGYVAGLFRGRKHAPPPLHRHRAAVRLQQRHHVPRAKEAQRAVQEPRVAGNLGQKLVPCAVVGQVAAAFPGDIDFLSRLFVMLQQGHLRPRPGCKYRGHHPGSPAADDQYLRHAFLLKSALPSSDTGPPARWASTGARSSRPAASVPGLRRTRSPSSR